MTRGGQALVSDTPGTTRDYLTAELDFDGRKCQLIDTAGFRDMHTGDCPVFAQLGTVPIFAQAKMGLSPWPSPRTLRADRAAQAAASEQIALSHVRLLCLDATRPLDAWEQAELSRTDDSRRIVVCTKSDAVGQGNSPANLLRELADKRPMVVTSSVTGQGIEQLQAELRRMSLGAEAACGNVVPGTAARCRELLHRAGESLQNACEIARHRDSPIFVRKNRDSPPILGEEFIAAEIRLALDELGRVVGAVYTDDVLDRIFSRFCVGK